MAISDLGGNQEPLRGGAAEDALWNAAMNDNQTGDAGNAGDSGAGEVDSGSADGQVADESVDAGDDGQGQQQVSRSIIEAYEARTGQKLQFQNDDEFLETLSGAYSRVQSGPSPDEVSNFQKYRPVLDEYAGNAAEFQQWKAQKQAELESQKKPEPAKPQWSPPSVSETTQRLIDAGLVSVDPKTRMYTGEPHFASSVKEANDFLAWQQSVSQRLVKDPYSVVREAGLASDLEALESRIYEKAVNDVMAKLEAREQERRLTEEFNKTLAEFSELDATGKPILDANGHPRWNDRGKVFAAAVREAATEFGITDQAKALAYARRMVDLRAPKQQAEADADAGTKTEVKSRQQVQQQVAPPPPTRKEKQSAFIDRARNGKPVNRLENANTTVAKAVALSAAENDGDLDSLWREAEKAARDEL